MHRALDLVEVGWPRTFKNGLSGRLKICDTGASLPAGSGAGDRQPAGLHVIAPFRRPVPCREVLGMMIGLSSGSRRGPGRGCVGLLLGDSVGAEVDVVGTADIVDCRSVFDNHLMMDVHDFYSDARMNGDMIASEAFNHKATVVFPITVVHLTAAKNDFDPVVGNIVLTIIVDPKVVITDKRVGPVSDTKIVIDTHHDSSIAQTNPNHVFGVRRQWGPSIIAGRMTPADP